MVNRRKITRRKRPSDSLYGKVTVYWLEVVLRIQWRGCATQTFCVTLGILKNENGVPEDEENFEEAIKNVNTALNPTKV